jgi:hypothetical protein
MAGASNSRHRFLQIAADDFKAGSPALAGLPGVAAVAAWVPAADAA